jgi:hydrogenase 3 maturation protease
MPVVLGVGNRLRGDDAVGCIVCDELQKTGFAPELNSPSPVPGLFVLDCGNAPENYVQPIADRKPDRILIVDCCDYGAKPGEFRVFDRSDIDRLSYGLMSTHTLPLTLAVELLALETKADVQLLGVQPQQLEFNTDLSPAVRASLSALVQFIRDWARA